MAMNCQTSKQFIKLDTHMTVFTVRCYAESVVLLRQIVCLSVTLRYRDHIGWNSSTII